MKLSYYIALFLVALFVAACSTTKNIPEGEYLLSSVEIKTDNRISASTELGAFVRQQPNGSLPLLGKVRLRIFNMAGDTARWVNRFIQRMGEPPVIFNERLAQVSASQLEKEMRNRGYLNAEVDTLLNPRGRKMAVTYDIRTGTPYRIRNYTSIIEDTTIAKLANVPQRSQLRQGDLFDMTDLENERIRINRILRNWGYYTFSREFVYFRADTTLNSYQVDLFLNIYPRRDSLPYSQYRINDVTVVSGYDFNILERVFFRNADTTEYKGMTIIRGRDNFLKSSTIERNNFLNKGSLYRDINYTGTYQAFNNIRAIRQTNIILTPHPSDSTHLLDARIILSPANAHWFRASLEGTNSAGDIGIAPSVAYQHQNIFNGGEQFSITLRGAYEFINSDNDILGENYYEYGFDISLIYPRVLFPRVDKNWRYQPSASTRFSIGLMNQHRSEYTRQFFNASVRYNWSTSYNRIRYSFDLLDINYVHMPWVSDRFREDYLEGPNSNPLLRESYKDQFIVRNAISTTINSRRGYSRSPHSYTIRTSAEVAGILPRLVTTVGGLKRNEEGYKQIFGVQYAEYIKGTADYARTFVFSSKHSLAYHIGFGMAYPYGNSNVLPFERRFFSGGANSVRGWNTRTLGPGSFQQNKDSVNFVNQVGDIKLDMSIESRHRVSSLFEIAGFIDAGNIWTIHNYEGQAGGMFKFNRFYKEIAVAYGIGLRLDLDFLLFRFDVGVRAYDPGRKQSQRFVLPAWPRTAFHFGIGYPF